jgi:hypothetical protein
VIAIVAGALANKAWNGGNAWARLSWTQGLERLGIETFFVEQLQPGAPRGAVDFFAHVMSEFGLADRSALLDSSGASMHGLARRELEHVACGADLLVNMGGHLTVDVLKAAVGRRVYVDDDPGYTQFWHAAGDPSPRLEGHDDYVTFGSHIGRSSCPIPSGGIEWIATVPPVVLAEWPPTAPKPGRFTTIGTWRGPYGPVEHEGRQYGQKVHQFRMVADLPRLVAADFELALAIDPAETRSLDLLERGGWHIADPSTLARDPHSFRRYVRQSGAEFSVAQGMYVDTQSGWFSDRTTRYLATGKPAIVQNTGFADRIPAGRGLLAFSTLDEAVAAVECVLVEYESHAEAARALAERYFDSDLVLGRLLTELGLTA